MPLSLTLRTTSPDASPFGVVNAPVDHDIVSVDAFGHRATATRRDAIVRHHNRARFDASQTVT